MEKPNTPVRPKAPTAIDFPRMYGLAVAESEAIRDYANRLEQYATALEKEIETLKGKFGVEAPPEAAPARPVAVPDSKK